MLLLQVRQTEQESLAEKEIEGINSGTLFLRAKSGLEGLLLQNSALLQLDDS